MKERALARLIPQRPLRLIDLAWSAEFVHHPCNADGVHYPCRRDPTRFAAALFERRHGPKLEVESQPWYGDGNMRPLLGNILDHYGFDLIETVSCPDKNGPGQADEMEQTSFRFE